MDDNDCEIFWSVNICNYVLVQCFLKFLSKEYSHWLLQDIMFWKYQDQDEMKSSYSVQLLLSTFIKYWYHPFCGQMLQLGTQRRESI